IALKSLGVCISATKELQFLHKQRLCRLSEDPARTSHCIDQGPQVNVSHIKQNDMSLLLIGVVDHALRNGGLDLLALGQDARGTCAWAMGLVELSHPLVQRLIREATERGIAPREKRIDVALALFDVGPLLHR